MNEWRPSETAPTNQMTQERWSGPIPPKKAYRLWTEEQVAALIQAHRAGELIDALPAITGHPRGSCATKLAELVRAGVLPARVRGRPRMPVQRVAA